MAFNGSRLNPTEQPWDTTPYTHLTNPNLAEVYRALDYNAGGQPGLRTIPFLGGLQEGRPWITSE